LGKSLNEEGQFEVWLNAYSDNYFGTELYSRQDIIARQAWLAALNYAETVLAIKSE
jgi:hypothetical protein